MEDHLLQIIKAYCFDEDSELITAHEINDQMMEFITWLFQDNYFFHMTEYNNVLMFGSLRDGIKDYKRYTLNDCFLYWVHNIKKY
jgi:hypothetical protein